MPTPRLTFDAIKRRFGRVRVLEGVSGEATAGGVLLVTGTNGSGKSTLLRCLAGLLAPDAGTIEYSEGETTFDIAARRRAVGWVAPDLFFYEELTTLENLHFFARLRRMPPTRCKELLERVGLPTNRLAGALSSGMLQRLRWAWAMLPQPRALLLDEPYQNLDVPGIAQVRGLLEEHLDAGGLAVVANPSPLEIPRVEQHLELAG